MIFLEEADICDDFPGHGVCVAQSDGAFGGGVPVRVHEAELDPVLPGFDGVVVLVAGDSVVGFHSVLSFRPGRDGKADGRDEEHAE